MIRLLLWDVDGTLLDFKSAERAAIKGLFEEFSLGRCSDDMLLRYSQINEVYWKRLERNEITKSQVLIGRFEHFFQEIGVEKPALAFFNAVFDAVQPSNLSEVMIVGDSLTSDIQGGINAGIQTCWYNPDQRKAPSGYSIDYIISDLHEVIQLVEE